MDQEQKEIKRLISQLSEKVKENNKILKGLRNHNRFSAFLKIVYWLIIIGAAFGTWYVIQPVLESSLKTLDSLSKAKEDLTNSVSDIKSIEGLDTLLKLIKK